MSLSSVGGATFELSLDTQSLIVEQPANAAMSMADARACTPRGTKRIAIDPRSTAERGQIKQSDDGACIPDVIAIGVGLIRVRSRRTIVIGIHNSVFVSISC